MKFQVFNCNFFFFQEKLVDIWEPKFLMDIIMLSAEYAKLYGYHNCEVLAWKMALKLAGAIGDDRNYVRGKIRFETKSKNQIHNEL